MIATITTITIAAINNITGIANNTRITSQKPEKSRVPIQSPIDPKKPITPSVTPDKSASHDVNNTTAINKQANKIFFFITFSLSPYPRRVVNFSDATKKCANQS